MGFAVISRAVGLACLLSLNTPIVAHAQESRPSRLAVDTVAVFNRSVDADGNNATDIVVEHALAQLAVSEVASHGS